MNNFMNFVKKSLARGEIRGKVGILEKVRASSLLASDFIGVLASSSHSIKLNRELSQELRQVVLDPGIIVKDRSLNWHSSKWIG